MAHGKPGQALGDALLQCRIERRAVDVGNLAKLVVAQYFDANIAAQVGQCVLIDPTNGVEAQGRLEGLADRGNRDGVDDPHVLGYRRTFRDMCGGVAEQLRLTDALARLQLHIDHG